MQNKKINKFLKNSTEYYREHVFSLGFSNTINLVGHGVCAIAMLSMNYVQVHRATGWCSHLDSALHNNS